MNRRYTLIYISIVCIGIAIRLIGAFQTLGNRECPSSVTGVVRQPPIKEKGYWRFEVEDTIIKSYSSQSPQVGDRITAAGKCQKRVINRWYSENWLVVRQVSIIQKYGDLTIQNKLLEDPISLIIGSLSEARTICTKQLETLLTPASAAVAAGMTLGAKRELSEKLADQFRISGLSHLVVASGSNIILFAGVVSALLKPLLSRRKAIAFSYILLGVYVTAAGLEPPIVRAGIMVGLLWLAQFLGRKTAGVWILAVTAVIMLMVEPKLLFSASFQLSVAASAGLILFGRLLETVWTTKAVAYQLPGVSMFASDLSQVVSVNLFVLPLLFYYFESSNLLSLIANVAVGMIVPLVVVGTFLLLALSAVFFPLAQFLGLFIEVLVRYITGVAGLFSTITVTVDFSLPFPGVVAFWVAAVLVSIKLRQGLSSSGVKV